MCAAHKKVDLKCVMLGRAAVGKSCLVERFLHDKFSEQVAPTIGAAFGAKKMKVGKKNITLGIWDTAGSERYESMTRHYYKGAEAAVVCYDVVDAASFTKVKFWVNELLAVEENVIIALVGTKADLLQDGRIRAVPLADVKKYAATIKALDYETSARKNTNVQVIFEDIVREWDKRPKREEPTHDIKPLVNLTAPEPTSHETKKCCEG